MWFLPIVPGFKQTKILEKWCWNILRFLERFVQPTVSNVHDKDDEVRYEIVWEGWQDWGKVINNEVLAIFYHIGAEHVHLHVLWYFCSNPCRSDDVHKAIQLSSVAIQTTSALISRCKTMTSLWRRRRKRRNIQVGCDSWTIGER
jgi:hypothetical protein